MAYATARAAHEAGLATEFGVLVPTLCFGCGGQSCMRLHYAYIMSLATQKFEDNQPPGRQNRFPQRRTLQEASADGCKKQ